MQKIENHKSLRPRILEELADVLGVSPAWLMYGDTGATCQEVDDEALAVARTWSTLEEPHRSAMRDIIFRILDRRPTNATH